MCDELVIKTLFNLYGHWDPTDPLGLHQVLEACGLGRRWPLSDQAFPFFIYDRDPEGTEASHLALNVRMKLQP